MISLEEKKQILLGAKKGRKTMASHEMCEELLKENI